MNRMVMGSANSDSELVQATLAGNRDAFGQIVTRYQTLICALTYSATGNLGQSEDLAQETFVSAWNQLAQLREPEKLRAWLCGIARNLIRNSIRKHRREPSHGAEPIENVSENHSPEPLPVDHTISNEEQAILWRSLERIPDTYREPLVLFYREQQSAEAVAERLELSIDAVHQRLSRGRKLLAGEVATFIEGALARTNPGQLFTMAVLAALPTTLATTAKAATVAAAAAKGGATATGATLTTVLGALLGPALGLVMGFMGMRASLKSTRTPRERAYVWRFNKIILLVILFFLLVTVPVLANAGLWWGKYPKTFVLTTLVVTIVYGISIFILSSRFNRGMARLREEERRLHPESYENEGGKEWSIYTPIEYRSRITLLGLPLLHYRVGRFPGETKARPAIGWIAYGERAYGILFASGAVSVGCISMGAVSVGLFSFGGFSFGLLAFGGISLGAIAMGGAAMGMVASGGLALGWHAALGGVAMAHEFALAGSGVANHVNDRAAQEFFRHYYWLNYMMSGPRNLFWILCFGPVIFNMMVWKWCQKKLQKRARQDGPAV